jgi:hypothetical protein
MMPSENHMILSGWYEAELQFICSSLHDFPYDRNRDFVLLLPWQGSE